MEELILGEHTTSVNGKGKDIIDEDMLQVAKNNKIDLLSAKAILDKCKEVISENKDELNISI